MPLFFGRKDKDTITARLYIDHIETTARITNWDDAWKLSEIYLVLHDRDIIWCNLLEDAGIDRAIKNEFLSFDKPRYTAMITCANITELTQCQGERVHDYYLLVHDAFFKMSEAKPAYIATLWVISANIAALVPAVAPDNLSACKKKVSVMLKYS